MWYSLFIVGLLAVFGGYRWWTRRQAAQVEAEAVAARGGGGGGPVPVPPK